MGYVCLNCRGGDALSDVELGIHRRQLSTLYRVRVCAPCLDIFVAMIEAVTTARQDPLLPGWVQRSRRDRGG